MSSSLAAEARRRAREQPFLYAALRAGVVNYRAAADFLDVEGDAETIATALRRYADELPPYGAESREVRVRMRSGLGFRDRTADGESADQRATETETGAPTELADEAFLSVGGRELVPGGGSLTAVTAGGEVDARLLSAVLDRLATADVVVDAVGVAGDALIVVVPGRQGATALQIVEAAAAEVPT